MPLIVKSRRLASSSGVAKVTDSGRRPSRYGPSVRKVATSTSATPFGPADDDHAETRPNRESSAVAKEIADFVGAGVGGDVVILGQRPNK